MLTRVLTLLVAALLAPGTVSAADGRSTDQYAEFMSSELYSEAAVVAKQQLSSLSADAPASRRADLLLNLALAQKAGGELESAAENLLATLDLRSSIGGNLDPSLAEPLEVLGDLYFEAASYEEAIRQYLKAVHVTNVNDGPHNLAQAEALEKASEAELRLGNTALAVTLANRAYFLFRRAFDPGDQQHVDALLRRGSMLGRAGQRREERDDYEAAIGAVRAAHGDASPMMIDPLISMAGSLRDEYFEQLRVAESDDELPDANLLIRAETYFERAIAILDRPAPDWQSRLDAALEFADFLTLAGEHSRSRIYYRQAWELLSAEPSRLPMRRDLMQQPVLILDSQPLLDVDFREVTPDLAGGREGIASVTARFVVGRNGRVQSASILEAYPDRNAEIEAGVLEAVQRTVYRPRFERGIAVISDELTRRFEYRSAGGA